MRRWGVEAVSGGDIRYGPWTDVTENLAEISEAEANELIERFRERWANL